MLTTKTDLLTSSNGFWAVSVVGQRYRITDRVLHRVGVKSTRSYNPFVEVGLPNALARIWSGELSPLEFASEFGELGYSRILRNTITPLSVSLPKSTEWQAAYAAYQNWQTAFHAAARNMPEGDPLDWTLAHSKTVALCLEFSGLLMEGNEKEIRDAAEGVERGPYAWGIRLGNVPVKEWRHSLKKGVPASAIVRLALCNIITENITGIRRWLVSDVHGSRAESSFLCNGTIEAVYWQLADGMEAKDVRRCLECRRFFLARDKRQQYCPALPGSTRSRCSSKLNVRNHRERQG